MRHPERGVLFVVSGPSGVGKSTLLNKAMERLPLQFSVSATTRDPRAGEEDGVHYHFLTPDRFAELVEQEAFVEHATVYNRSYGTLKSEVESKLSQGISVILDIDVQGAQLVREAVPNAVMIHLLPPSVQSLRKRLEGRGTDSKEVIDKRMEQVALQLDSSSADYIVVNDDLASAHVAFQAVLMAAMSRRELHTDFLAGLTES